MFYELGVIEVRKRVRQKVDRFFVFSFAFSTTTTTVTAWTSSFLALSVLPRVLPPSSRGFHAHYHPWRPTSIVLLRFQGKRGSQSGLQGRESDETSKPRLFCPVCQMRGKKEGGLRKAQVGSDSRSGILARREGTPVVCSTSLDEKTEDACNELVGKTERKNKNKKEVFFFRRSNESLVETKR
jgi:hypothetical protein